MNHGNDAGPSNLISHTRRSTPTAYASQYSPAGRRHQWWITYTCPWGCGSHFGRSRTEIKSGVRHAGCGRKIRLVVARTYKNKQSEGAA
ncbi:hypothetical protein AB0J63_17770 [Streptosporangium canum]|uniref:hypothetical protein n=1 Tax=Streptosporangium canum TaxID=324952 RepID=UPI00341B5B63